MTFDHEFSSIKDLFRCLPEEPLDGIESTDSLVIDPNSVPGLPLHDPDYIWGFSSTFLISLI